MVKTLSFWPSQIRLSLKGSWSFVWVVWRLRIATWKSPVQCTSECSRGLLNRSRFSVKDQIFLTFLLQSCQLCMKWETLRLSFTKVRIGAVMIRVCRAIFNSFFTHQQDRTSLAPPTTPAVWLLRFSTSTKVTLSSCRLPSLCCSMLIKLPVFLTLGYNTFSLLNVRGASSISNLFRGNESILLITDEVRDCVKCIVVGPTPRGIAIRQLTCLLFVINRH